MYALKVRTDGPDTLFARTSYPPEAFHHPIAVIEADHAQQLALCDVLDRLLRNPRHGATAGEMAAVHDYLRHDLPRHIADEEEDLFPLMRRRAAAGDDIKQIFELLHQEHQADCRLNEELCGHVECLVSGHAFVDPARFMICAFTFAETQRRHLAWENAVVLTRARKCLDKTDQAELGRRMAKRRSIAVPG